MISAVQVHGLLGMLSVLLCAQMHGTLSAMHVMATA